MSTRHLAAVAPPNLPAPGPALETLAATTGATQALTAAADLLDVLALVVDANATTLTGATPHHLAAVQHRRDATTYRRVAALLRQPLNAPDHWYDALTAAFDGRFVEEELTR